MARARINGVVLTSEFALLPATTRMTSSTGGKAYKTGQDSFPLLYEEAPQRGVNFNMQVYSTDSLRHSSDGGHSMLKPIRWESNWDMALSMARVQEKHVLLDFFNPG